LHQATFILQNHKTTIDAGHYFSEVAEAAINVEAKYLGGSTRSSSKK